MCPSHVLYTCIYTVNYNEENQVHIDDDVEVDNRETDKCLRWLEVCYLLLLLRFIRK